MKLFYLLGSSLKIALVYVTMSECVQPPPDEPVHDPIDCDGSYLNTLPELSSEGRGIAGCLLDGEVWVPYSGIYYGHDPTLDSIKVVYNTTNANPPRVLLHLVKRFSNECDTVAQSIYISAIKVETGEKTPIANSYVCFYDAARGGLCERDLDTESYIQVLNLNKNSKTISGRFAFNAVNWRGDTIRITEGRFDTRYQDDY